MLADFLTKVISRAARGAPLVALCQVRPARGGFLLGWAGYPPEAIGRAVKRLAGVLN